MGQTDYVNSPTGYFYWSLSPTPGYVLLRSDMPGSKATRTWGEPSVVTVDARTQKGVGSRPRIIAVTRPWRDPSRGRVPGEPRVLEPEVPSTALGEELDLSDREGVSCLAFVDGVDPQLDRLRRRPGDLHGLAIPHVEEIHLFFRDE